MSQYFTLLFRCLFCAPFLHHLRKFGLETVFIKQRSDKSSSTSSSQQLPARWRSWLSSWSTWWRRLRGWQRVGLINLLQLFLLQGHGRTTHLHWLLLGQLGLPFIVLLVRGNFWPCAGAALGLSSGGLHFGQTSCHRNLLGFKSGECHQSASTCSCVD